MVQDKVQGSRIKLYQIPCKTFAFEKYKMVISNILKSLIKSSSLFNQTATSYNLVRLFLNYSPVTTVNIVQAMRSYNTSRRALLYVPGNDLKKLKKAFNLKVDCIAMDCEDGVAINKKVC